MVAVIGSWVGYSGKSKAYLHHDGALFGSCRFISFPVDQDGCGGSARSDNLLLRPVDKVSGQAKANKSFIGNALLY